MVVNEKFYENLGSYYSIPQEIYEKVNSKIFNDYKLTIKVIGVNLPQEELSVIYQIKCIEVHSADKNNELARDIEKINSYLSDSGNHLGYKEVTDSWTLFYLIKEMITTFQKQGFNYYRGQNQDWETIPGIFRPMENEDGNKYFDRFESLYLDISREFPASIRYIPLNKDCLEERADELSILQHYGLPTSLLDISENPFIAMLFMLGFGEINRPQLEFYKIDYDIHSSKSLVSFVHKNSSNKRIRAQKGAFINFDKLVSFVNFQKNEIKLDESYIPIDRIVVQIEFDKEGSIQYLKQLHNQSEVSDSTDNLSQESIANLLTLLETDNDSSIIESYYKYIKEELLRKLKEFHYEAHNLYPDFENYLTFKAKEFKFKEKSKENRVELKYLQNSSETQDSYDFLKESTQNMSEKSNESNAISNSLFSRIINIFSK